MSSARPANHVCFHCVVPGSVSAIGQKAFRPLGSGGIVRLWASVCSVLICPGAMPTTSQVSPTSSRTMRSRAPIIKPPTMRNGPAVAKSLAAIELAQQVGAPTKKPRISARPSRFASWWRMKRQEPGRAAARKRRSERHQSTAATCASRWRKNRGVESRSRPVWAGGPYLKACEGELDHRNLDAWLKSAASMEHRFSARFFASVRRG